MEKIETSVGEVEVGATDGKHVYVRGIAGYRGKYKTFCTHFYLWKDGKWHHGKEDKSDWHNKYENCFISKLESDVTEAFRDKVIRAVEAVVPGWCENNQHLIKEAANKQNEEAVQNRRDLISKHQKAIQMLQNEIDRLTNGEELPSHTDVDVDLL